MEQDSPKDIYRIAYDEAFSELREILREFEQLRMQKDLVERVRCRVHTAVLTRSTFV
jgi:hypothetical protein